MSRRQITILMCVTIWSLSMWGAFYIKWSSSVVINTSLSDEFKMWEAQSRLALMDDSLDDVEITNIRVNWHNQVIDLAEFANMIIARQNHAYGFENMALPRVYFVAMRGDANGLYVPKDSAIYINSKMKWHELPFERFVSVILHENMHHIMTYAINYLTDEKHPLKNDFILLAYAASIAKVGLGDNNASQYHDNHNPQEWVACRAQNAAKFMGIMDANLQEWDMAALMVDLRNTRQDSGL